jgi:hypothetical protein
MRYWGMQKMGISTKVGRAAAAAAVAVVSTGADATTHTIDISLSQLLNNGGSYGGAFDISGFLAPSGGNAHELVSATVTAYGYSDAQYSYAGTNSDYTSYIGSSYYFVQTGGGYYVSQTCGSFWSGHYECGYYVNPYGYTAADSYYQVYNTENQVDGVVDTMHLSVGEGSGTGSDSGHAPTYGNYQYQYTSQWGNYTSGYQQNDYFLRTAQSGTFGDLLAQAVLSANDVANAGQSGLVNFTVGATGQFHLQDAHLSFEIADLPVPEPATWAMMVGGFGVAGWAMRRDRRGKKAAGEA